VKPQKGEPAIGFFRTLGSMPEFRSFDGTRLHYEVHGDGRPVVLLHSFGFDGLLWEREGVVDALVANGRAAITLDARGHGKSDKPRDPAAYADDAMARDVSALLDRLQHPSADLAAYSMGSIVGLRLLQLEPRIDRAVLGGIGERAISNYFANGPMVADALEAEDVATVIDVLRPLRERIERRGEDRVALAALMRAQYVNLVPPFDDVRATVLILTGERDEFGSPQPVADAIPGARAATLDADHATAMDHPDFASTIVSFLAGEL